VRQTDNGQNVMLNVDTYGGLHNNVA